VLTTRDNVKLKSFPRGVVTAARNDAVGVVGDLAGRSEIARRVYDSYKAFRERTAAWSRVSLKAVLEAREG
jgi:TRAP-type mannitol/chloroaromatic compound transport system substrate-binding protein